MYISAEGFKIRRIYIIYYYIKPLNVLSVFVTVNKLVKMALKGGLKNLSNYFE